MAEQIILGECAVEVVQGDITRIAVDAIVNAANSALVGGGGVDGAIHSEGGPELMRELRKYDGCPTGSAVVTGAGRLPAKYVFHAVGPVYRDGLRDEGKLLADCYRTVLKLAAEYACASISIPSISTGVYGFPVAAAAEIAISTVKEALTSSTSTLRVVKLVQFSESDHRIYGKALVQSLQQRAAQTS